MKNKIDFYLASQNSHKFKEFQEVFIDSPIRILLSPVEKEVDEIGDTFYQNSLLKASEYFKLVKRPILADDSGLVVEAHPEILGVKSKRFGENHFNDTDRNLHLLKYMENFKNNSDPDNRKAYFVCVLCFYFSSKKYFFFEGRLYGHIAQQMTGEGGFGYDPVFLPIELEGKKSLADSGEWKNENSHRARACKMAINFFKERNCQNK